MAGDWIKMRSNLWDDPRVAKMCDITDAGEAAVVGGLYWLWATADQHTETGMMNGLTAKSIDRKTGIVGFTSALMAINWLIESAEGMQIVRFEEHNGTSAKRRCSESKRKMSARDADNVQIDCGIVKEVSQQFCAPREEKEKENKEQDQKQSKRAPRFDAQAHLVSIGVDAVVAADWLQQRKALKASPTMTAIDGIAKESARAGISISDALAMCCQRGWRGFKAEWAANAMPNSPPKTQHQINQEATARAFFGSSSPPDARLITGEVVA